MKKLLYTVLGIALISGCASMKEDAKIIWGSSTKTLEEERKDGAIRKIFTCDVKDCFDAVLKYAETQMDRIDPYQPTSLSPMVQNELPALQKDKVLDIFLKDRKKNMLIVMGIPEHVDTTEAGIFFTAVEGGTMIEITSLSTGAKIKVAEMIFENLKISYKELAL